MRYYSTRGQSPMVSLKEAIVQGLAPDKGLYMPERINRLPDSLFNETALMSLTQIAQRAAHSFFGEDIPAKELDAIVADTLNFDIPLPNKIFGYWSSSMVPLLLSKMWVHALWHVCLHISPRKSNRRMCMCW